MTAQLALTARSTTGPLHPTDYRTFFDHALPFDNQFTLIAGYQGVLLPITFEIYTPDEATNRGTRVFFHFHQVVLVAFFMDIGKPSSIRVPTGFTDASHIIWPFQRGLLGSGDPTIPLTWPPPLVLDEPIIQVLIDMLATG